MKNFDRIIPRVSDSYYEDTAGHAFDVCVSGNYAYVADNTGLAVLDISDPTNPGAPFYESTSTYAYGICVQGDYAYVAVYTGGLAVIDISDPTNPGTPVYEDTTSGTYDVFVRGDYAYLASGSSGLMIVDISEPTNPGTPVYADTTGTANGVYVSGNYAYVADGSSGLAVINIVDPTNPGTPVYEDTADSANYVFVSGNYAYIADWDSGLAIIDISNPADPSTPIYEDTTGSARKIYVSGDYAYIANYEGLAVINIADPTNPGTPVYIATTGGAQGVYVIGDYAYVASGSSGLAVIDDDVFIPKIIQTPSDLSVESDYAGQSLSWAATDAHPSTYTIELQGSGIVAGPTAWISGATFLYYIPDGFEIGTYVYMVNFTDETGNSITDNVTFTVSDTTSPIITSTPSDLTVESDYSGQSLSWAATDVHPSTYTIELQGSGIVAGPTAWISGATFLYYIPDGFAVGVYIYTVTFTDDHGHFTTDSVTFTVEETSGGISIPGASFELIVLLSIGIITIMLKKRKNIMN